MLSNEINTAAKDVERLVKMVTRAKDPAMYSLPEAYAPQDMQRRYGDRSGVGLDF